MRRDSDEAGSMHAAVILLKASADVTASRVDSALILTGEVPACHLIGSDLGSDMLLMTRLRQVCMQPWSTLLVEIPDYD